VQPSDPDDDWFAGAGLEERPTSDVEPQPGPVRTDDDWLDEAPPAPRRLRSSPAFNVDRRILVVAGSLIVLLLAGLAAGGVFSGSKEATTPFTTTTAPTTTRPATTAATTPAAATVPVPSGPLKPGDSGAQVEILQRALARLGFSAGKVDGDYGPSTTEAVKRFQQSKQLTADGICGSATIAALRTALRGQ
jgi:hypothetical protein